MAVNDNGNYAKLNKDIISEKYKVLSVNAKWLYCVLTILENKHYKDEWRGFWHTDEQLSEDSGMSLATVKRAKKELRLSGLIEVEYIRQTDSNGRNNSFRKTLYRISR